MTDFASTLSGVDANRPVVAGTIAADIMGMFTPELLPVLAGLAKGYAVCDRWFSSVPTETIPNRAFVNTGHEPRPYGRLQRKLRNAEYLRAAQLPRARLVYIRLQLPHPSPRLDFPTPRTPPSPTSDCSPTSSPLLRRERSALTRSSSQARADPATASTPTTTLHSVSS